MYNFTDAPWQHHDVQWESRFAYTAATNNFLISLD